MTAPRRYVVTVELDVRAEDIPAARAFGEQAFRHLLDTFNDDGRMEFLAHVTVEPWTPKRWKRGPG